MDINNEENVAEYSDFAKLVLKVGQVIEAEEVPETDRLIRMVVDLGDEKRQIVAGIRGSYEPESMLNKKIAVVYNLKPRKIRGLLSQGMLLAASTSDHGSISVLTVDREIPNGSLIR